MTLAARIRAVASTLALISLAACGGGGGDDGGGTTPPPPATGIGAAGGTVTSGDAKVVIPAGALTSNLDIAVAKSAAGAPPLPAGVTPAGDTFAFTPHGTTFAKPVTITIPFDPAKVPAGEVLVIYKTNSTNTGWDVVHDVTQDGSLLSANVSGFSLAFAATQPPEGFPELTEKTWNLEAYDFNGEVGAPVESGSQVGGAVSVKAPIGEDLIIFPTSQPDPPRAQLWAYSTTSGKTFGTVAQAPRGLLDGPVHLNTSNTELTQTYTFKVRSKTADLRFVMSRFILEVVDLGGNSPSVEDCPWLPIDLPQDRFLEACGQIMMEVNNSVAIQARAVLSPDNFYDVLGSATIRGIGGHFHFETFNSPGMVFMWSAPDFAITTATDQTPEGLIERAEFRHPVEVIVPVGGLEVGQLFNVTLKMSSYAQNLVQGESYALAYLRDPVDFTEASAEVAPGITMQLSGLEQVPVDHSPVPAQTPVACAGNPVPENGQLRFVLGNYEFPEKRAGAVVEVERIDGTRGEVKVMLDNIGGTATAGSDFAAQHRVIRFGDGEGGTRAVQIPLTLDRVAEDDESVLLGITPFSGCAVIGDRPTTTVTIQDDDRPVAPPPTFTVSGTISGLTGSGLVLQDQLRQVSLNASGTTFAFPTPLPDNSVYHIVVQTPPSNPPQACTVANGDGTIHGANVTNVTVTCTTPATSGTVDTSFGDHGRASTGVTFGAALLGGRVGLALQADGKMLLVGGLKLLRLNADGTMDTAFGSAGVVPVVFNGQTFDTAMDVAVQADGKIVVAGTTSGISVGSDDFAVTRFNADGTLDTTFGTGGHVTTDFFGSTDQVRRMKLQPDGKILVTGRATHVLTQTTGTIAYAVARYSADGVPDASFGSGGISANSPGGTITEPLGLAIDSSGAIVTCGRSLLDGAANSDTGFVKFLAAGIADPAFGTLGNGSLQLAFGDEDSCVDVLTAENDDIVGAIAVQVSPGIGGPNLGFGLVRMNKNAIPAPGAPQLIATLTASSDSPKAMLRQPDGKIVMVGESGVLSSNPDMAAVRFREDGLALDPTFGTDGKLTLDFFGRTDQAMAVARQPDGKLVLAGLASSGSSKLFALTRLNP